ncbi:xanthine dehydrogenase family protein subunit M [Modestobacter sp. I12A-02628]|uniref:Xanthine dehydrogenase family protein subunit M n=1 Tax=Goekera deserti TaxID=2497753 RepID=A0A7K3WHU9_9ACTN|nr:FAD binding domain-containing protein [Goekera deserti]MPQ97741.1 xanthine dehydrogenase family protein subunit M [Goekera deserti]NDI48386.1 xanthine dehydrogenase family protein subunit M [Goekera deserti]NEL55987.1 xanthine dehydrogenase family protein subunit M [Goekera deserti]
MLLAAPRFALPETVGEALSALAERPDAVVVAGGTEVMPDLLWRVRTAAGFVSLRRVGALRGTSRDGDELVVGAGTPVAALVDAEAGALAAAARSLGTPLVRTEATIGGNVVSALPYRNMLPALLALDARLELTSDTGRRTVAFDGFTTAPGVTRLGEGELLTAVRLPTRPCFSDYVKIGRRNAQYVATVSAAVVSRNGAVRLAFGNAGPVPLRSDAVDVVATALLDGRAGPDDLRAAVADAVDPPEDTVASAAYRRHALGVLATRLVVRAQVDAGLGS